MIKKYKIDGYSYEFRNMPEENVAMLYLKSNGKIVCLVAFVDKKDEDIPPPRENPEGIIYSACKFRWMGDLLDMLRNEMPVFLFWDRENQILSLNSEDDPEITRKGKDLLLYFTG